MEVEVVDGVVLAVLAVDGVVLLEVDGEVVPPELEPPEVEVEPLVVPLASGVDPPVVAVVGAAPALAPF